MKLQSKNSKKKKKFGVRIGWKDIILYGFLFLFLVFVTLGFSDLTNANRPEEVPLSQVINQVEEGNVEEIIVSENKLEIKYADGSEAVSTKETGSSLYEILQDAGVSPSNTRITIEDNTGFNTILGVLTAFLPILIIIGFFYFIFRQARGAQENIFSFGSNKAKAFNKIFPKVTFGDVAGADEAKEEMTEVVDFLKHPEKYVKFGARTPKGVLLVGPAGTGKTLLARAVAGEAKVPFFSIAGSEFMEMLVGVGAARVRDLFNNAKKSQPAIIFIDEIDAIGRTRGGSMMGGHDEREQTLNQILVEMDGFTPREQIVVIAATNRPDILDSALVRPGRFDRRIVVGYPDIGGRREIIKIHSKGKPFGKSVDWESVAKRTVGFTGADLENMLNEAAILAARYNKTNIDDKDIEEAATKVKLGPQKKRIQLDHDKEITAYHESGHAIVSYAMPTADPVHRISIVGRGMSLGHTLIPPAHDRVHETKTRLLEQIATMLGGRAAEEMIFSKNDITTGAADDIDKATELARSMVIEYGMSNLGAINLNNEKSATIYGGETSKISESMHAKIDSEIMRILDEGMKRAVDALKKNRKSLDNVAAALLKKESLDADEFVKLMKGEIKKTAPKKIAASKKL